MAIQRQHRQQGNLQQHRHRPTASDIHRPFPARPIEHVSDHPEAQVDGLVRLAISQPPVHERPERPIVHLVELQMADALDHRFQQVVSVESEGLPARSSPMRYRVAASARVIDLALTGP